jgi:hypothetical protein
MYGYLPLAEVFVDSDSEGVEEGSFRPVLGG